METKQEYALFIRRAHWLLGVGFIATIILAPLGIWLIHRGSKQYEAIMALEEGALASGDEARAIGLASSWDDVAVTNIGIWEEDLG